MKKKYLVTGAAGFIGSQIANSLIKNGNLVWAIDNLSTGYEANIPAGVVFIKGDCQDPASISALKDTKYDAIFHIAGQSSGEISFDNPVYDLRTNTEATLLLLKHALRTGCNRFLYASSMSVYGSVEDKPINEDHICQPLSFYGVGKLASEHYLRIYENYGVHSTALRLFNVYGPGQNMHNLRQGMVSIYLAYILGKGDLLVKGALDRFRDFIFIDDAVAAFMECLDNRNSFGKIYNVGTGRKTTINELIPLLLKSACINKKIVPQPGTPGDQKGIYADISRIQKDIDFTAKITLEDGIAAMVNWAQKETNT